MFLHQNCWLLRGAVPKISPPSFESITSTERAIEVLSTGHSIPYLVWSSFADGSRHLLGNTSECSLAASVASYRSGTPLKHAGGAREEPRVPRSGITISGSHNRMLINIITILAPGDERAVVADGLRYRASLRNCSTSERPSVPFIPPRKRYRGAAVNVICVDLKGKYCLISCLVSSNYVPVSTITISATIGNRTRSNIYPGHG